MEARMKNPAMLVPEAMNALHAMNKALEGCGVPKRTLELVHLRVSQINGCGVCLDGHRKIAKKEGETDERLFTVAAWRDTPYFTPPERAALALAEELTRIADRSEGVSDAAWDEAKRHYDERALAGLLLGIAQINVWNRLNVATRQVAGAAW
ncbi:MAG: carboxymuconolactone decarboxylase family protein [Polyangiaceae bacterium]